MKSGEVTKFVATILDAARAQTTRMESFIGMHNRMLEELEILATKKPEVVTVQQPGVIRVETDVEDDLPIDEALLAIVAEFKKQGAETEAAIRNGTPGAPEDLKPEGPQGDEPEAETQTTSTSAVAPAPAPPSDDPAHDEPAKSDTPVEGAEEVDEVAEAMRATESGKA